MLFDYLNRVDLWEIKIDNNNFEKEYSELSELKITVGEGKDFYEKLGSDSELLNLNNVEKNENEIKINEKDLEFDRDNKNVIIIDEDEEEEINTNSKRNDNKENKEEKKSNFVIKKKRRLY